MNYDTVYKYCTVLQAEICETIQNVNDCGNEDELGAVNKIGAKKIILLRSKIELLNNFNVSEDKSDDKIKQRIHNTQVFSSEAIFCIDFLLFSLQKNAENKFQFC